MKKIGGKSSRYAIGKRITSQKGGEEFFLKIRGKEDHSDIKKRRGKKVEEKYFEEKKQPSRYKRGDQRR